MENQVIYKWPFLGTRMPNARGPEAEENEREREGDTSLMSSEDT